MHGVKPKTAHQRIVYYHYKAIRRRANSCKHLHVRDDASAQLASSFTLASNWQGRSTSFQSIKKNVILDIISKSYCILLYFIFEFLAHGFSHKKQRTIVCTNVRFMRSFPAIFPKQRTIVCKNVRFKRSFPAIFPLR